MRDGKVTAYALSTEARETIFTRTRSGWSLGFRSALKFAAGAESVVAEDSVEAFRVIRARKADAERRTFGARAVFALSYTQ
jgi:hypothetical protein